MSLKEQIEKVIEEEKSLSETVVDSEDVIEEKEEVEEVKEEPKEEPKEEIKDEPKEEVEKPKEEHKPSNQEWAEMRRVAKIAEEEKRKREELEAKIKEYEAKEVKEVKPVAVDVEPNKEEDLAGWLEWRGRQVEQIASKAEEKAEQVLKYQEAREKQEKETNVYNSAVKEFLDIEKSVKDKHEDYEDVSKFYFQNLTNGLRTMYPMADDSQIEKMAHERVLMTASQYAKAGINPVEAMYNDAKNRLGYVPVKKVESPKPSIKEISENKKRSVSSIVSTSQGGGTPLTKEKIMGMNVAEWSHLSPEALRELERIS